jgi:predicted alpha/beta-fold hydrolase
MIKVPSFFLNALDDPIVGRRAIAFDAFKKNENVILVTSRHGGHLGYHESAFST